MCRWAAWAGEPKYLEDLASKPRNSLIDQSRNAQECKTCTNADGMGLAWYNDRPEPSVYKDVKPAWSDPNLGNLVYQIMSRLFMAHVRASTGTATSYNNCHPFTAGPWSFMHNGQVGGFETFRKSGDMMIPDHLYNQRKGATDSEVIFLLAQGFGLDIDPIGAMQRAVSVLHDLSVQQGTTPHMRLAACWSNGTTLYAARCASDAFVPTVYWQKTETGFLVVSEPLDENTHNWNILPAGQFLAVTNGTIQFGEFDVPNTRQVAA